MALRPRLSAGLPLRGLDYAEWTMARQGTGLRIRYFYLDIMSSKSLKSLTELISDSGSSLQRLAKQAQSRVSLTEHIRAGLTDELADRFLGCNLRDDGTLVVIATSPEWAARLRFESDRLLSLCREHYPATQRVKIRVAHSKD